MKNLKDIIFEKILINKDTKIYGIQDILKDIVSSYLKQSKIQPQDYIFKFETKLNNILMYITFREDLLKVGSREYINSDKHNEFADVFYELKMLLKKNEYELDGCWCDYIKKQYKFSIQN